MADDISQPTPEGTQVAPPANQNQGGEPSPEELEFNKLTGPTQERFRKILRRNRELSEQYSQAMAVAQELQERIQGQSIQPNPTEPEIAPDVDKEQAIENLRKFGVWTKKDQEELEARWREEQEVKEQKLQDDILIESEYSRLEATHNGADGLPRFDREAIEEYMAETGVYNPEKAYEDLYRDEIFDKWAKEQSGGTPQVYSNRPSTSVGSTTEPLSMDGLRERLRQPDGRDWWEKNRERLLPYLGELFK